MKIKVKMTFMGIAMTVAVALAISVVLLSRASTISMDLSIDILHEMADLQSEYWNGRINGHVRVLRTLANVMAGYESLPPETRRDTFDEMIRNTVEAETVFLEINTVWRPNAIDGMDAQMIGRTGSSPTGQYAVNFTREAGINNVSSRYTTSIPDIMAHIQGPNARLDRVEPPFAMEVWGNDTSLIRISVPIINSRTNEVVGMVSCLLDLVMIQPSVVEIMEDHEDIAAMSIYANNGFIIASYLPDNIGYLLHEVPTMFDDNLSIVQTAVRNGEALSLEGYSASMRSNTQIEFSPFTIGNSDMTWTVMLAMAESTIMAPVRDMTNFAIVIAAIVIVIGSVIAFLVYHFMTKPIVTVTDTLKDISEGEGDLTVSINISTKDEIGDLANYFNKTLEKIKNLIIDIKKEAGNLSDIGNDLAANMNETAAAVNEITANIQSIKGRVINQSASVSETHATMEQLVTNIDKLNGQVENQSNVISQATVATDEMNANIQSIADTLIKNGANVKNLREASEAGRGGLQEVAGDIQEIARESEGLLEINSVMENIASQTNLLSMNAAIEAAHAGEAGKGFAVVADEIRKLAESSGEQSKTIGTVLKKIKGSIDKITDSTNTVLNRFEAIDSNVRIVSEQEEVIRRAMEEQGEGNKQLLMGVAEVNEITRRVKSGANEMHEGAREVISESANLEKSTQEITSGMNEMASGAEQINVAVNAVNDLSSQNRNGIQSLMTNVSRFKVD